MSVSAKSQELHKIEWLPAVTDRTFEGEAISYLNFKGASFDIQTSPVPELIIREEVGVSAAEVESNLEIVRTSGLSETERRILLSSPEILTDQFELSSRVVDYRGRKFAQHTIRPVRKLGSYQKLLEFKISTKVIRDVSRNSKRTFAENSVLSGGDWFKIGVTENGVYKIDYDFLKAMGVNVQSVSFGSARVFGNGGGMLPESNDVSVIDDLVENPIKLVGAEDQRFDKDDYILFYAQGPHHWKRNGEEFTYQHNVYSDTNYYFLTFNGGSGSFQRVTTRSNLNAVSNPIRVFNDFAVQEIDKANLISSGRMWFGENFSIKNSYTIDFDFPNIISSRPASVFVSAALRSVNSVSTLSIVAGGIGSTSIVGGNVTGNYTSDYAVIDSSIIRGNPSASKFGVTLSYAKSGSESNCWIDRVQVNCQRSLNYVGPQMHFRSLESVTRQATTYRVDGINSTIQVWDVTDPRNAIQQGSSISGSSMTFTCMGDTLREFVAFSEFTVGTPSFGMKIANQNLHALTKESPNYLIISAPEFLGYAEQIGEYHTENSNLDVAIVTPTQIYNEFSSGRQDISALKNFLRMLYQSALPDSSLLPKYVLLFGDASYDYKSRISGNTNFVPIYQTINSVSPTNSLASDDYIAFLADDYNGVLATGIVQVGVGRFPVKNARQAAAAVNKVLNYNSKASMRSWRNRLAFVGDDEDNNVHMIDANELADTVDRTYPWYNNVKIMLDAYPQRSTPGGQRYPDVNRAIDDAVQRGSLTINYIGHGGELGWAHERVLEVSQINKWSNIDNLPLFVTATCEFSRFDDPKRTSAGEFVFLNPDGAGIGLLTTTRLVYSTPNKALAVAFNRIAYQEVNGEMPRLGDITRQTKADPTNLNNNSRVFALLGDPGIRLNYPKESVKTIARPDTIGALQKVTITGEVVNRNTGARINGFNGVVYPVVFDKKRDIETLNNDGTGSFRFQTRNNALFRGKATVSGGVFSFTFVVPKDINLNYGLGKISYYAENGEYDASGFDTTIVVGGQVGDASADQVGPEVNLYMNDSTFVSGGITDENPSIYAKLFDENGINTSGGGIGHDLIAIIDEKTEDEIVLNEFYESNLNSYQKGSVNYPLSELAPGSHTLRVKAWDVYNNSGEAKIDFVVSSSAALALEHVLNYPNPFTTNTSFYFEHNYPEQDLFVRVQVFTISGKIVRTIDGRFNSRGYRIGPIKWNGLDDFGDKIGRGVYVYRIMVKAPTGEVAEKFEKLVILN